MLLSCLMCMECSGWVTDGTPDSLKGCVQALPFGEQRPCWRMSCFTVWIQSNLTYNTRSKKGNRCEHYSDRRRWESRMTRQAKFSGATYSKDSISTCADRQHSHPDFLFGVFMMSSRWWDQLRKILVRALQARSSVYATIVRLPNLLATRQQQREASGPHRREGGCHECLCIGDMYVALCWVRYSCPAGRCPACIFRGQTARSFLAQA